MTKPIIELTSCNAGDWSVLRVNLGENFEFQGHSIPNHEWIRLIKLLGYKVEERIISDEDMEYGNY